MMDPDDLTMMAVDRNHDLIEMGEALQKSSQLTRLTFCAEGVDHEAAISFLKTAIYASSLRRLDFRDCNYLDNVFEDLALWPVPQDSCKESALQELCLPGIDLTKEHTVKNLITFLLLHVPKLRCFYLAADGGFNFVCAVHFAEWLETSSLVKLDLNCTRMDIDVPQLIFSVLHNHSTLKCFQLVIPNMHSISVLRRVIRMATEAVRVCQLQSFLLEVRLDDVNIFFDEFERNDYVSQEDYDAFMQAFAVNTTLMDIVLWGDIDEHIDEEKLDFYGRRNREFQEIISTLIVSGTDRNGLSNDDEQDEAFRVNDNDRLSMARFNGNGADSNSTIIPLGLWPYILEAAHKQFPHVSMLHHLLLYQVSGPVLSEWEERNATATEDKQCRNTKRDYCQISAD
jgi:hypothetical protein